jgi:hypothetical protein
LCPQVDADLDIWFPAKGQPGADALRICGLCTVQAECLEDALEFEARLGSHHGIRGGTTAAQRKLIAPKRPKPQRVAPVVQQVRRMAAAGWNDTQIGAEVGMSPGAVGARRHRHGIAAGQPQHHPRAGTRRRRRLEQSAEAGLAELGALAELERLNAGHRPAKDQPTYAMAGRHEPINEREATDEQ